MCIQNQVARFTAIRLKRSMPRLNNTCLLISLHGVPLTQQVAWTEHSSDIVVTRVAIHVPNGRRYNVVANAPRLFLLVFRARSSPLA
jgi:hypothetical protein